MRKAGVGLLIPGLQSSTHTYCSALLSASLSVDDVRHPEHVSQALMMGRLWMSGHSPRVPAGHSCGQRRVSQASELVGDTTPVNAPKTCKGCSALGWSPDPGRARRTPTGQLQATARYQQAPDDNAGPNAGRPAVRPMVLAQNLEALRSTCNLTMTANQRSFPPSPSDSHVAADDAVCCIGAAVQPLGISPASSR